MGVLEASFWGAVSASSLLLGALIADRISPSPKYVGMIMGFGAGTLLGAIAYVLMPNSEFVPLSVQEVILVFLVLGVGVTVFYLAESHFCQTDEDRPSDAGKKPVNPGTSIAIGAVLDGIPESLVIGVTLAIGGQISLAFLMAVFISNIPEGLTSTHGLRKSGMPMRKIYLGWLAMILVCTVVSALGFYMITVIPSATGIYVRAFNAGAVLAMLASTMIPEAVRESGRTSVLLLVLGFALAATLSIFTLPSPIGG